MRKRNTTLIILLIVAAVLAVEAGYFYIFGHKDLTGASYAEIEAYRQAHPRRTVTYTVTIDDSLSLTESDTAVTLTAPAQTDGLTAQAEYLQHLTCIHCGDTVLTARQLLDLQAAFPKARITYDNVELLGQIYPADTTELTLTGETVNAAAAVLPALPKLTDVYLDETVTLDHAAALYTALPNLTYHYTVQLFGQTISTDMETVKYFKADIGDEGLTELRKLLPMMYNLTRLTLDWCGTSDEATARLRDDFADDFKVVWRIFLGRFNVLTDSYKFWANGITQAQADRLRYCTEIRYIDIGHSSSVKNVDFLGYMPHLQVCIIADSGSITSIEALRNCRELEYLEIFNNPIKDLSPLENIDTLQHLNFSDTAVKDLGPLYTLKNLQRVWGIANEQIPLSDIDDLRTALPDLHYQRWAEHPTDAGWRFLDKDETVMHPRYALLRWQIGYANWDSSIYPKGHVTEEITYESTGIKPAK